MVEWTWVDISMILLATWRVCLMIALEEGPWSIFSRLRKRAGRFYGQPIFDEKDDLLYHLTTFHDEYGEVIESLSQPYDYTVLARGLACVWCLSIWVIPVMILIQHFVPTINFWLSLSMLVVILHEGFQRMRK